MFRVGMKVVCVRGRVRFNRCDVQPAIGEIYTVRSVFVTVEGVESIRVNEIIAPLHSSGKEYGFDASRFRPVVDTDISIFTAMLNPSLEDLRAIVRENANVAGAA